MCVYSHLHPSLPQLSYKQKLVCVQRQSWYALYIKTRDWAHTNWYAHKDRGLKCIQAGIHYIKTETWAYTNWCAETETYLNTQIHTLTSQTHAPFSPTNSSWHLCPPHPTPHTHTSRTHMPVQVHSHAVPIHSPPPPTHTHRATDPDRRGSTGQAAWPGSHRLVHRTGSACIPPFLPETKNNNLVLPKTDLYLSSTSHFSLFFTV